MGVILLYDTLEILVDSLEFKKSTRCMVVSSELLPDSCYVYVRDSSCSLEFKRSTRCMVVSSELLPDSCYVFL